MNATEKCAHAETTRFGFIYGAADVSRVTDGPRLGSVVAITTDRECMEIRITPGGRISILDHRKNLK